MTKLTSGMTFFFKRVFPIIWIGIVTFVVVVMVSAGVVDKAPVLLLSPLFLAVVGYVLMKKLLWDLMDEVYDQGDSLLIRNGSEEETIPLANIMNVSKSTFINPPRVTLRLVTPCRWGSEVVFSPIVGLRLNPFAGLPAIDDLIMRIDQARRKRAD